MHVLADGISSCNKEEVPLAIETMRQAGAQITTSESILFQLQGTYFTPHIRHVGGIKCVRCLVAASSPNFKAFPNAIKAEKEITAQTLQTLLPVKHSAL